MGYYVDTRLEFLDLARECLAKMPLLDRLLVGGDASGFAGGYAAFNRAVYHSQYFWTKASTDRVRRHFLDYDFYQGAQYIAAMEYVTATYSTGSGKVRNLPPAVVPRVARLIALHDSMRESQARLMAPYLKEPPPFEAIDVRMGISWMTAGADASMGRAVALALDFNSVDTRTSVWSGNSFGPASVDYGDWRWDGHYDKFYLPTREEVGFLQAAWRAKNAGLPGGSKLSFYGWLRQESAPGGRDGWPAGEGKLWWTSTYEADNTPIIVSANNGNGPADLSNAAKVYIFRFDTAGGDFLRDAIGQTWCAADPGSVGGFAKYVTSPNIRVVLCRQLKLSGTFRNGAYYDRNDLRTFDAALIPVRRVPRNEAYWMPSSSAN
jgi:hypothetical protein